MHFRRVLIPVALLSLLGSGCATSVSDAAHGLFQRIASKVAETGAEQGIKNATGKDIGVRVTDTGATFTDPKTGRVLAIGDAVSIPAGFPADVPLYPGAVPTSVTVDAGGSNAAYIFSTTHTRFTVRDWFNATAVENGWKNDQSFETVDQIILSFTKPSANGTAKLTVTVSPTNVHGEVTAVVARSGRK